MIDGILAFIIKAQLCVNSFRCPVCKRIVTDEYPSYENRSYCRKCHIKFNRGRYSYYYYDSIEEYGHEIDCFGRKFIITENDNVYEEIYVDKWITALGDEGPNTESFMSIRKLVFVGRISL